MIKGLISKVVKKKDLSVDEMEKAMDEIMSGDATPAQIGAFITALRMKGETVDEITGAAKTMRAKATKIFVKSRQVSLDREDINIDEEVIDIVGTGGDGAKTFNVSTTTALVAAGAGVKVAKHGNRAVSSLCGSADVLEGLGVKLNISTSDTERCVNDVGIGFLFAPLFHGAMKHAAGPRKELGIRSIFNLLGPITNPAGAKSMVLGVYDLDLTEIIANVLKNLEANEIFVVCGEGTFDEISICGPTKISHLKDGEVSTYRITPEEYGLQSAPVEDIVGGNSAENAQIIKDILDGEKGAKRDMVLLNAAAAFVVAGRCDNLKDGISIAENSIDSGKAREKLDQLVEFTNRCESV